MTSVFHGADAPNIQEFNLIAGLIFAQLYKNFPIVEDIDRERIAGIIGVTGNDWSAHKLMSGRSFNDVLSATIGWLNSEGYIKAYGAHPSANVLLTTKALAAMRAVPSGLEGSLGAELSKVVEQGASTSKFDMSRIGDLIGGIVGGFTKSLTSG